MYYKLVPNLIIIKGTPCPPPLPPTHRKYHPPTYNTHTLINGPPTLPLTHRKYQPPTYNTHTLKGPLTPYPQPTGSTSHQLTTLYTKGTTHPLPPTPNPQGVPPTNIQHSYTKETPHPHPLSSTHREYQTPTDNTHTLINGPPTPNPPGNV